ncbi:hypothetical protein LCGC14_0716470 [marine sediment metagenome]|uniref:BppU N-terminal domain-containing protein n=1 Tax=marine sediment metagenome TaxID=412755 RepID=A0A0F9QDI9_9ZZZZ
MAFNTERGQRAPALAPNYVRHRLVKGAIDTGDITNQRRGMNMASHSHAHVQVLPKNGANPDVKILFWSSAIGKFIDPDVEIAVTGKGADVPYEFTFEPRGRIFFVFVTGTVTGDDEVEIQVAGFNVERV